MTIKGKRITLLVCGSIAAYKSAELVRELVKKEAEVRVAMTKAATEFIGPLTLQTLSGFPVSTDLFDERSEAEIGHIRLADDADVVVVAPATANVVAKAAKGFSDDLVTAVLLATKAPTLFVPAMNVNMWENSITQQNVEELSRHGKQVMVPETGELACGWIGAGRLPELSLIVEEIERVLSRKDLSDTAVIVAAGPTVEPLDPIRFLSNTSTGKMGYEIARAASRRGAKVALVSGPTTLSAPCRVSTVEVSTAQEMSEQVNGLLANGFCKDGDIKRVVVVMAAAVSDHRPKAVSSEKLKVSKDSEYSVAMVPNPDILGEIGQIKANWESANGRPLTLVGFSAESGSDETSVASAMDKMKRKNADLMVSNLIKDSFGKDTNRVWLLERGGEKRELPIGAKTLIAEQILDVVAAAAKERV